MGVEWLSRWLADRVIKNRTKVNKDYGRRKEARITHVHIPNNVIGSSCNIMYVHNV
jgi:hypothetical protein